jgi:hypothetical protein
MVRFNRLQLAETIRTGDAWCVDDDGNIDKIHLSSTMQDDRRETITSYTQAEYTHTSDGTYEYLTPTQVQRAPMAKQSRPEVDLTLRSTGREFAGKLNVTDDSYCRNMIPLDTLTGIVIMAVDRIGASKRKFKIQRSGRRCRQSQRGSMVNGLQYDEVLGAAWILAHEYPELDVNVIVSKAIRLSIKQGRQIASREVSDTDPDRPDYEQDTTDRTLELAYTVTSELDKTYRIVDGNVVALGQLLKQGYNQSQCTVKLGVTRDAVCKRIARARKLYSSLFEQDA